MDSAPDIANAAGRYLQNALSFLQDSILLPPDSGQVTPDVKARLTDAARSIGKNALGEALNVVVGTVGFGVTLFGAVFVGAYLLVDVRRFKAVFLSAAPHRYRRDAKALWEAFGYSLSNYLGGLILVLLIQGAISAVSLLLLGVPYPLALGALVSAAALIPYLGAWISGIAAVGVAPTVSPTTAFLTALLYLGIQQLEGILGIQQLEGNFLTPQDPRSTRDPQRHLLRAEKRLSLEALTPRVPTLEERLPLV